LKSGGGESGIFFSLQSGNAVNSTGHNSQALIASQLELLRSRCLQVIGRDSVQLVRRLIAKIESSQVSMLRFIACSEIFLMPSFIFLLLTYVLAFVGGRLLSCVLLTKHV